MSTTYTLPTQEILTDALEIMGVTGAGQTVSPEDYSVVMRSLQNILKELPLHGFTWPKVTAPEVAVAWSSLTPGVVSLPSDYYGSPAFTRSDVTGYRRPVVLVVSKADYDLLNHEYIDPLSNPSLEPQRIYIAANNIAYLWPIPKTDPLLRMTYQAIVSDAALNMTPDVALTWCGGLGLWVAYEASPKFGVDMATRQDIQARFMMRRALMLQFAAETAPITMGVWD